MYLPHSFMHQIRRTIPMILLVRIQELRQLSDSLAVSFHRKQAWMATLTLIWGRQQSSSIRASYHISQAIAITKNSIHGDHRFPMMILSCQVLSSLILFPPCLLALVKSSLTTRMCVPLVLFLATLWKIMMMMIMMCRLSYFGATTTWSIITSSSAAVNPCRRFTMLPKLDEKWRLFWNCACNVMSILWLFFWVLG